MILERSLQREIDPYNVCVKPQLPLSLLAIETSSDLGSVCLWTASVPPTVRIEYSPAGAKLSDWIVPAIDRLLGATGQTLASVDAIAFGSGPGSFTGVRTACATAQALAYATAKPLIAVSSMQALAALVDAARITVVLDARMGELYVAAYERDASKQLVETTAAFVAKTGNIEAFDASSTFIGSGVALLRNHSNAQVPGASFATNTHETVERRWAEGVALVASGKHERRAFVDPLSTEPGYVRNKVAFTEAERAIA
jgi:tRNA threonylcarbamoyladenosine biosynthesis protein TsaB